MLSLPYWLNWSKYDKQIIKHEGWCVKAVSRTARDLNEKKIWKFLFFWNLMMRNETISSNGKWISFQFSHILLEKRYFRYFCFFPVQISSALTPFTRNEMVSNRSMKESPSNIFFEHILLQKWNNTKFWQGQKERRYIWYILWQYYLVFFLSFSRRLWSKLP